VSLEREQLREEVMATMGDRFRPADRALVDDLLDLRELAAARRAAYLENPLSLGSRRQEVESPRLKEYVALMTRVLALSEALGVTPRARRRAGLGQPADDLVEWLHRDGGGGP